MKRKGKAIDVANEITNPVFRLGIENSTLEDEAAESFSTLIHAKNLTVAQIYSIANVVEAAHRIGMER